MPGVVDEDVEVPVLVLDPLGRRVHAGRGGDVDHDRRRVVALGAQLDRRVPALRLVPRADDRHDARAAQTAGGLEAESPVRARDQSDLLHVFDPSFGGWVNETRQALLA